MAYFTYNHNCRVKQGITDSFEFETHGGFNSDHTALSDLIEIANKHGIKITWFLIQNTLNYTGFYTTFGGIAQGIKASNFKEHNRSLHDKKTLRYGERLF